MPTVYDSSGNPVEVDEYGTALPVPQDQIAAIEAQPIDPAVAPPQMPDLGGVVSAFMGNPTPGKASSNASSSFSGITPQGAQNAMNFQAGLYGKGATAKKTDQMMAGRAGQLAQTERAYGDANALAKDAVVEGMEIESRYNDGLRQLHERQRDFFETQRHVEEQFYLHGQAERDKHVAAYQQQLGAVRQLMVQNANPLNNVGGGRALGLGMAEFAQGFLAAGYGININVSGQIDKWVDRELAQHQQKIANGMKMADNELTLYNIARQSASDDYDARQRLRGFAIEGFKVEIQAQADRFNSDIGRAKAKAQIAQLDKEQAATIERIGNTYFQNWHATYNGLVDEASKMGQLAIQRQAQSLAREKWDAEKAAAEKKAQQETMGKIVYDTSAGGGGAARWIFHQDVSDKEKADYRSAQSTTNTLQKLGKELTDLYAEYGNRGITDFGRFTSTDQQRIKAIRNAIFAAEILADSGKAATDAEVQRKAQELPDNALGTAADLGRVYAQTHQKWNHKLDSMRYELTDKLPENDAEAAQFAAKYGFDGRPFRSLKRDNSSHYDEAGFTVNNNLKRPGKEPGPGDKAIQAITAPHSNKPLDESDLKELGVPDAQGYWDFFRSKVGAEKQGIDTKESATVGGKNVQIGSESGNVVERLFTDSIYEYFGDSRAKQIPQYAAGIIGLARAAKRDPVARQQLQDIAYGGLTASEANDDQKIIGQEFARFAARQEGVELDSSKGPAPHIRGLGTENIFPVQGPNGYRPGNYDEWRGQNPEEPAVTYNVNTPGAPSNWSPGQR